MNGEFCEKFEKKEKIKGLFLWITDISLITLLPVSYILDKVPFFKNNKLFCVYGILFILTIILFHNTLWCSLDSIKKIEIKQAGFTLGTWIFVAIFMAASGIILDKLGIPNYNSTGINSDKTTSIFILFAITTTILGPVVEEVIYRFFIFRTLRKHNVIVAHVVTTVIFAFAHVGKYAFTYGEPRLLLNMIAYIPLGIGTSVVYEKNKNILFSMMVHIWLNILAL